MNKVLQLMFISYFLSLPFYSLEIVASISFSEIISVLLFLIMTSHILLNKKYNIALITLFFLVTFLSFCLLNFIHLTYIRDSDLFFYTTSMINILLIISIIFYYNNSLKMANLIFISLYNSSLFLAFFGLLQYLFANFLGSDILLFQSYGGDRITGFFSNPNSFAFFMHFGFFYSYYNLKKDFGFKKLIYLSIFILAIYLSGSFGAFMSIILAMIAFTFLQINRSKKIILILASLLTVIVLTNSDTFNRFLTGDEGLSSRLEIWSFAIENFKSNIIYGVGFGNFQESLNSSHMSHNLYLQILIETGVVGCILFLIIIGTPIILIFNNLDFLNKILVSAFISTLTHSFFINSFNNPMLWILISLIISYNNLKGRGNNEKKNFSISGYANSRRL